MDERHLWFAPKLQETFHFGGYDNPTLLEDFLSEPDVMDLINKFLSPGEPCKLFFYCNAASPISSHSSPTLRHNELQTSPIPTRRLQLVSQLTKDVLAQGCVCLYVLRKSVETEIQAFQMDKELYCGELKHSLLSNLATLLAEAYNPILNSQKNWKECPDETVATFLQNFGKFTNILCETATRAEIHQPILQKPRQDLRNHILFHRQDIRHGGGGNGLEDVVGECEVLMGDWIGTIESLLINANDERYNS